MQPICCVIFSGVCFIVLSISINSLASHNGLKIRQKTVIYKSKIWRTIFDLHIHHLISQILLASILIKDRLFDMLLKPICNTITSRILSFSTGLMQFFISDNVALPKGLNQKMKNEPNTTFCIPFTKLVLSMHLFHQNSISSLEDLFLGTKCLCFQKSFWSFSGYLLIIG